MSVFFQFSELGPKVCKVALFYTTVILTKYSASAVIIVSYNLYVASRTEISYYNYNNSLMLWNLVLPFGKPLDFHAIIMSLPKDVARASRKRLKN